MKLTDEQLEDIAKRHAERRELRALLPSGPYFYDSIGYVHNELAFRDTGEPAEKLNSVGVLVRSDAWFKPLDLDARMTKTDRELGINVGLYLEKVCADDVERDIEALVAEVRRLRTALA